jgi:uncharacterized protein (DUF2062 family)
MIDRLKRLLPTPDQVAGNRWLRWLGPSLLHPRVWHVSRRGIALGVSIGFFFAFLIPIAQIPLSAAAAVALRANLPTAVAGTLVNTPLTFPAVYYGAWRVGNIILGEPHPAAPPSLDAAATVPRAAGGEPWIRNAWHHLTGVGKPLLVGTLVFAVVAGLAAYLLVNLAWHLRVRRKRSRRLRQRAFPPRLDS